MKNKILLLSIICLGLFGLKSCTDEDNFRLQAPAEVEELTVTNGLQSEYILIEETFGNIAERFTWESPDFGVQSNVTYDLEYSVDGLFENPILVGSTSENQISITIQQLWDLAQENLELTPNTDADNGELFFRIKADLGAQQAENSPSSISPVQVLFVRLIESGGEVPIVDLFLVGNATAADWDNNNNNPPLVRDPENPNAYSFTGKFLGNPNEFKLLETRGQWQPQWGLDNDIFISSDELGFDPGSFVVSGGEGYYTLNVNTDDGTWSFETFDESDSPSYTTVGIIGSATTGDDSGWNQDMDLTQSTFDSHLWYMNGLELFDGETNLEQRMIGLPIGVLILN